MNTRISFEQNGDMIATPETGGAVYIGRVDSDGDIQLVPGDFEISMADVIEAIIETMNADPEIQAQEWKADFTKAAAKAGEKNRIPKTYLFHARLEEYQAPPMREWWSALKDAENREECHDAEGNVSASFWTDGERIWAAPGNFVEKNARQIGYIFETGVGYVPIDL